MVNNALLLSLSMDAEKKIFLHSVIKKKTPIQAHYQIGSL